MPENFVQSFSHLKNRPKADQALPLLQKIASLVKPIMRKHSWTLPVLSEFFPESPNLVGLNVNGGQKICLRLRPAHAPDTFYDEGEIVQTMLHELTHNVHGPHDEKFYEFLSGLQEEYIALKRSGYAGEGFFSKGQRVGTNISHNLPLHLGRLKAFEAAEKRRKISNLLGSGGRLGGRAIDAQGMTPRELALRAAERRARDEKACAAGPLAIKEAAKAAKESIKNKSIIDLTMDNNDSDSDILIIDEKPVIAGPSKINASQSEVNLISEHHSKISWMDTETKTASNKTPDQWSCPVCTLLNGILTLQCEACFAERPLEQYMGWNCLICGEVGMPQEYWSCRFCGGKDY